MASNYVHEITEREKSLGVTLEAVADVLAKGAFFNDAEMFAMPCDTPPILASSVARCAFGKPVEF